MKTFEELVNNIPTAINPCDLCEHKTDVYDAECAGCCYFYGSKFGLKKSCATCHDMRIGGGGVPICPATCTKAKEQE